MDLNGSFLKMFVILVFVATPKASSSSQIEVKVRSIFSAFQEKKNVEVRRQILTLLNVRLPSDPIDTHIMQNDICLVTNDVQSKRQFAKDPELMAIYSAAYPWTSPSLRLVEKKVAVDFCSHNPSPFFKS